MNNTEPNAEQNLCWNCKHGMCIREVHQEHLLNMMGMQQRNPGDDPFGAEDFNNQEDEEQIIEHEHIRSVCFWRPPGVQNVPPILVGFIKQCSQFDKKST